MRTLGPGSVSSFLKIILDVAYVTVWIGVAASVSACVAMLVFDVDPSVFGRLQLFTFDHTNETPTLMTTELVAITAYLIGVVVIVARLRRIFATLTAGDPFHPDNVLRLRVVGLILMALELGGYPMALVEVWLSPDHSPPQHVVNLTAWFAVLVVFVLAEVFREGARLRREAELTI